MSGIADHAVPSTPLWRGLIKLARPKQWSKSAFVAVGPAYWLVDHSPADTPRFVLTVGLACLAFALASSGCYVFNDLADVEQDRNHPRKRNRPIASGVVPPGVAKVFGVSLFAAAGVCVLPLPAPGWWICGLLVAAYIANVMAYSAGLKRIVIADVMSLSMGFVIRVVGGCAAIAIAPTTWLLNVVLFLSMTLAFGKRLGERRASGIDATSIRGVQKQYSDELLRMALVVTAVGTLLTYAGYVTSREADFLWFGFNTLWLSLLPATFGLLRAILLLEHGRYDDPTELAVSDRAFQASAALFGVMTVGAWLVSRGG
jgi:decaprenyl-phosphate phosphoribosyltransferase